MKLCLFHFLPFPSLSFFHTLLPPPVSPTQVCVFVLWGTWRRSVTKRWYCLQRDENSTPITTVLMSTAVDGVEPTVTRTHTEHAHGWTQKQLIHAYTFAQEECSVYVSRLVGTGVLMCVSLLGGADLSYASFSKLSHRDLTCFHCRQRNL